LLDAVNNQALALFMPFHGAVVEFQLSI
jgi:hypothetical protein